MSGDALVAIWETAPIDWNVIEPIRLAIPDKRRPSQHVIAIIDSALASFVIPSRGYADPTYEQILSRCSSIDSTDTVKYALQVLRDAGRWITIRASSQGQKGKPGRAPRRVFFKHDPMNLLPNIDFSAIEEVVKPQVKVADAINKGIDLISSNPKKERIKELESQIRTWRHMAETGPAIGAGFANARANAYKRELEKEMMDL